MSAVTAIQAAQSEQTVSVRPKPTVLRPAIAVAGAAIALVAIGLFLLPGLDQNGSRGIPALTLLGQASAAEEEFFKADGVFHMVNEILVKPVSDPTLAQTRWFPLVSLEPSGTFRYDQLNLPAKVDEGYTVQDQCWYEGKTGRFVRLLTVDGTPVFANSFDGKTVCSLSTLKDAELGIKRHPVTKDFQRPKSPSKLLGIAAGFRSSIDERDESLFSHVGDVTLEDGSECRVVKASFEKGGPENAGDSYSLFTIRKDNNTVAQIEHIVRKRPILVVRGVRTETVEKPEVAWDLTGIEIEDSRLNQKSKPSVQADVVILDVSVKHMVEKADFKTYVFGKAPTWTHHRSIMDVLDIPSPPHRMFLLAYPAKDDRHVVLVQSHTYNKMAGPLIKKAKLEYTAANGVKVWSGPQDKWMARILLVSAKAAIEDPPSTDLTGYFLETPGGTFPALAINGQLSREELQGLAGSLVPAEEALEEKAAE